MLSKQHSCISIYIVIISEATHREGLTFRGDAVRLAPQLVTESSQLNYLQMLHYRSVMGSFQH